MKYYTMTAVNDMSTGELGYKFDDVPAVEYPMVATEGLLVAHDLLEHQNGLSNIGTVHDEIEALAGVWLIRGQWGDMKRDSIGSIYSSEENIASDVLNMGAMVLTGSAYFKADPVKHRQSDHEYMLDAIKPHIKPKLIREFIQSEHDENISLSDCREYYNDVLNLLCAGAIKANKRFKSLGGFGRVNNLFWNIAEASDYYVKHAEFEGHQIEVGFDFSGNVNVRELELEEWH